VKASVFAHVQSDADTTIVSPNKTDTHIFKDRLYSFRVGCRYTNSSILMLCSSNGAEAYFGVVG